MPTTLKPSELQTDQILLKITLGVTHPPGKARADRPPWVCAAVPRSGTESPLPTAGLQGRGRGRISDLSTDEQPTDVAVLRVSGHPCQELLRPHQSANELRQARQTSRQAPLQVPG